ncbi:transglycosylase domain-containing protein [Geminicoccus flavidas]|uniref:transglycosylase domain-containing protein n=1 Tax=Geminicoccus flavidas TaxID=2506407 RepID=UPI00135CB781|nr:transglycosylase domain-containing protein [Geminicoccus flavidas]
MSRRASAGLAPAARTARSRRVVRPPTPAPPMPVRRRPGSPERAAPPRPGWRRRLVLLLLLLPLLAVALLAADAALLASGVTRPARTAAVTLLDRRGVPLTTLGDGFARPLTLDQVARPMIDAIVAIEDRRFFAHDGIDPTGVMRAALRNLAAGRISEGGSTITQQLAKLAFLTPERSFLRKLREAALALWLDATLSKKEILAAYLDRIYLGSGVTGIRAAARRYFAVEAAALDLPQAALLAGLVKAPSRLDPGRNADAAQARAGVVLQAMAATGAISQHEADAARARPARILAPGYADPTLRTLAERARRQMTGALVATTTLDAGLSRRARQALLAGLAEARRGATAGAMLVLSAQGEVLAAASVPGSVGGLDRAGQVRRQPGSAFKPVLFAAALEAGYRPDQPIPTEAPVIDGWRPRNMVALPGPEVTLAEAMALSVNTAAVRLGMAIGLDEVIAMARRLGIASDLPAVPSLLLGSAELGMPELAAAYAAMTGDGRLRMPVWLRGIRDEAGHQETPAAPAPVRALQPQTAATMRALLAEAMQHGTGKAAAIPGGFGKTGTSSDFRDAWFVGGTGNGTIVAVWVGNDDRTPMGGETGGGLPARIFRAFVTGAP